MKHSVKRILSLFLVAMIVLSPGITVFANDSTITPSIAVQDSSVSLFAGKSAEVEYYISGSGTVTAKYDSSCVTVRVNASSETVTITANSNITSAAATTVELILTAADGSAYTRSISVKITPDSIKSVSIMKDGSAVTSINVALGGSTELTALAAMASGDASASITWFTDNASIASLSSSSSGVTVKGNNIGAATVTATASDGTKASITVNVVEQFVESVSISSSTLAMYPGTTDTLTVTTSPADAAYTISWSSSKTSVVTVDNNGSAATTLTAVANGTAMITAAIKDSSGTKTVTCTVTVSEATADVSVTTPVGTTIQGLSSISSSLSSKYKSIYGTTPAAGSAAVTFSALGSSTCGTLYKSSSTSSSNKVATGVSYTLSAVSSMYFVPSSRGKYTASYTLSYNGNSMSGTMTINVGSDTADITVSLDSTSAYSFSSSDNGDGTSAYKTIYNAVKNASGSTYSYIRFGSVSSGSNVGTLYGNSSKKALSTSTKYYYSTGQTYTVNSMYFVPKKSGTYKISYTAYNSSDSELCSGYLIIRVDSGSDSSDNITINLTNTDAYKFSSSDNDDGTAAYKTIYNQVYDETGTKLSYIKFGSVTSGSSVGTLYGSSAKKALSTSTKYYYSTSQTCSLYDLYFVPKKEGTYKIEYTAYDSSSDEIMDGYLIIAVGSGSAGSVGGVDIFYNTTTGTTITLGEDAFEDYFQDQKGSGYKLAYVTFDESAEDYGTFKHSSSSFLPGNGTAYYTDSYTGSISSSAKYLKNVKFTAGSSYGCETVTFTCYGGTSSSKSNVSVSGTLYIFATKGSVKTAGYSVSYGTAEYLDEDDFLSVYKTAMSSSSSSTKFYIELLEIPSKGTLYLDYTSSSKTGTKMTSSNIDDYLFYINASSSYDSVADLTYIPANSSSGSATVRYLAYSSSGVPLYVGSLTFSYGSNTAIGSSDMNRIAYSDGYRFERSDFYSSSDDDPVIYVTFRYPSSGGLYVNYANGSGISVSAGTKLYTADSSDGTYSIDSLTYIPKAGYSGTVSITYTAYTESGDSITGAIDMAVNSKISSDQFTDVDTATVGSWASDAIDYSYTWGLVNGVDTHTFAPYNTMSRAMLVTVLYRIAGSPAVTGDSPFYDVDESSYYCSAVIWAYSHGIVSGVSDIAFDPDGDVTREQVATFLYRYADYVGADIDTEGVLDSYIDQFLVSDYAYHAMSWAVEEGFITSTSVTENLLSPSDNATRAQAVVMLHRFLTY